jgi:hippurate hydrolase
VHGGNTWNVIPEQVVLRGTCRYFKPALRSLLETELRRLCDGIATLHGVEVSFAYRKPIPPAVNAADPAEAAARAATLVAGDRNVHRDVLPSMGCEDFAFMLAAKPGCYVWIGNGPIENGRSLHSARYDFNDAILPLGASYWSTLVETVLVRGE